MVTPHPGRRNRATLRERKRRGWAVMLALVGAVACVWCSGTFITWASGDGFAPPTVSARSIFRDPHHGGLLGLPRYRPTNSTAPSSPPPAADDSRAPLQFPLTVRWNSSPQLAGLIAIPLWMVWLRTVVRRVWGRRTEGLAEASEIRRVLGARQARANGKVTWPAASWWQRLLLPTSAFGYRLGNPMSRRSVRWMRLWARFETNVRLIAHTGWGKTLRLLVPIVRELPAGALISTNEQMLFTHTVLARRYRRPLARWPWLRLVGRYRTVREFPVAVADFSDPNRRWSAGFPQVRWNPIPGCEDHFVAARRAEALIGGAEPDKGESRGNDKDRFWRQSAADVIAAWLHAAALGNCELDDIARWLKDTDHPTPRRILADSHRAEPTALTALDKHLDQRAEGTTSGVERYVMLAVTSLINREGRRFCGSAAEQGFDIGGLIEAGGTLYLLADDERIKPVRPLLSLFAAEVFIAARRVALTCRGARLPQPFIAVLDELRHSVIVPNLPYVGNTMRKHGVGFLYAVQTSAHEEEIYGDQVGALRQSAGVTVVGGLDMTVAEELASRAGTVTRSDRIGGDDHTEQLTRIEALPVSDQQRMSPGQAVIAARGAGLFLSRCRKIHDRRWLFRRITRELAEVRQIVRRAQQQQLSRESGNREAAAVGVDFIREGD